MADSSVDVDPGTGGSKVPFDTRTEATNSNHRQVIVVGDPSTNAGVAPVDATKGLAVDVKEVADQYDHYEAVAVSTDATLGATGATGDFLAGVLVIPGTTSPGSVQIGDATTDTVIFAGGTDSVSTLHPFFIPLGISSVSGAWSIITGANVTAIGVGRFT